MSSTLFMTAKATAKPASNTVRSRLNRRLSAGVVMLGFLAAGSAIGASTEAGSPFYHWLRNTFFDVDKVLAEQLKIEFSSCEYYSNFRQQVVEDRGVGACLFQALRENLSSPAIAGMVRAKVHPLREKGGEKGSFPETIVHIVWNPSNRRNTVIANVFRLVSELLVPSWIKSKDDALLGTLVFRFPKHDGLNIIPSEIARRFIGSEGQALEMFSISLFPVQDPKDAGTFQGAIYFFAQGAAIEHPMHQIQFKTDLPARGEDHFLDLDFR